MMKSIKNIIRKKLLFYGFNVPVFLKSINIIGNRWFRKDLKEFKQQKGLDNTFIICKKPILLDRNEEGGTMKGHYFHQDLYVAREIFNTNPKHHLDIGSRTDGFVAHVASFRQIEIIDIRPIKSNVKNIIFKQADLMELPTNLIECYDSVSSLHAIEHFGLGRYGDPIDYYGHIKAINNIAKILKPNGIFYFSVPIGPQRVEFNAHRVFSIKYLISILTSNFLISKFSYINDEGIFFENIILDENNITSNLGCYYGCGIFICTRR